MPEDGESDESDDGDEEDADDLYCRRNLNTPMCVNDIARLLH
ncbi:hypothetical protein O9X98_11140 [Agrobacterium salinitolerans]|nr:hypothetical protein [Agrobacterium salinitolerans]